MARVNDSEKQRAADHDAGAVELVGGIIDEARTLVEAHVEALREDMSERLASLGAMLSSALLAFSVLIVMAVLLGFALAATLVAIGLPWWAALWIITLAAAGLGFALVQRARAKARTTADVASRAGERAREDVAWIAGNSTKESS